jgi:hypothetical protein
VGDPVVPRSGGFETFGQRDALEFDANVESLPARIHGDGFITRYLGYIMIFTF